MAEEQNPSGNKAPQGKAAGDKGDAVAQPSAGGHSATGGQSDPPVVSSTPEGAEHRLNPSAPGETGTTPKSNDSQK